MRIFITGTAGFIGFHLAKRLLDEGHEVFGYDAMTPYYDLALKRARRDILLAYELYHDHEARLEDMDSLVHALEASQAPCLVHLAAQAGVRYSLENPRAYLSSNIEGTFNLLEAAKACGVSHLLLASTSSAYGANAKIPFEESDPTDQPLTLYAASKKSTEVMAHAYAHLWDIPTTVFRFFTVYGPYGRPDMAPFKFVDAAFKEQTIDVYGMGKPERDYTYIDDLIEAIVRLMRQKPERGQRLSGQDFSDTLSDQAPYRIVNIGGGQPVGLMSFIEAIEAEVGKPLAKNFLPMQPGDVPRTFASHALLKALIDYVPQTTVAQGIKAFVAWYKTYHHI